MAFTENFHTVEVGSNQFATPCRYTAYVMNIYISFSSESLVMSETRRENEKELEEAEIFCVFDSKLLK